MSQPDNEPLPLTKAEFVDYIVFHSHKLSPHDLRTLVDRLPALRPQFQEVRPTQFPHTPERLDFLAAVVEAFVRGDCQELPFESAAEAAFALLYFAQEIDLLPDFLEAGRMDDAAIVALVLERSAPGFKKLATEIGRDWEALAVAER